MRNVRCYAKKLLSFTDYSSKRFMINKGLLWDLWRRLRDLQPVADPSNFVDVFSIVTYPSDTSQLSYLQYTQLPPSLAWPPLSLTGKGQPRQTSRGHNHVIKSFLLKLYKIVKIPFRRKFLILDLDSRFYWALGIPFMLDSSRCRTPRSHHNIAL